MNKIFSVITMLLVALAALSACIVNYIQAKDIQALQQQIVEISKEGGENGRTDIYSK